MRKSTFEEEIAHNGFLLYRNVGDSMLPLIRQGKDLLLIARKPQGRLNKYDVPLYRRDSGQYVLHRILKVRKNDYVLCGDNRWRREVGITDRAYHRRADGSNPGMGKSSRSRISATGCMCICGAVTCPEE